jgi:prepilin-type N-terminal cleavage/methylation domain-containing protein
MIAIMTPNRRPLRPASRAQRGLSLVELMVGIAIGLVVVAGAIVVTTSQLGDNRRLLLETQLQQDLRATADIISRELRRAGSTNTADGAVWFPGSSGSQRNDFAPVTPASGADTETVFSYRRSAGALGPYGFKLEGDVIQSQLAAAGWQDLTDAATMRVTEFTVTEQHEPPQLLPCPKLCSDTTTDCWPEVTVRKFKVEIAAEAVSDPAVRRNISSVVRLRNDWVRFRPDGNTDFCPA